MTPPPLPYNHADWLRRVLHSSKLALIIVVGALTLGVLGYHVVGELPWIDALLEASMILGGMGAVAPMHSDAVKLFASFYALFSGLVVVSTTGILLAPWIQRLIHHPHHAQERETNAGDKQ